MKYKNTKSARLLNKYGKARIKQFWINNGYQKTADYFETTKSVIRGIVKQNGWKRPAAYTPNILNCILNGTKKAGDFPHIDYDPSLTKGTTRISNLLSNEDLEIYFSDEVNSLKNSNSFLENGKSYVVKLIINTKPKYNNND